MIGDRIFWSKLCSGRAIIVISKTRGSWKEVGSHFIMLLGPHKLEASSVKEPSESVTFQSSVFIEDHFFGFCISY